MITIVFGKPRAGKTTFVARLVQKNKRKLRVCSSLASIPVLGRLSRRLLHPYDVIYCTDETISDTIPISYECLGRWRPAPNSLIVLEEAGIGLNNRDWKKLSNDATVLFAKHGHIGVDILALSQTIDVDIKLRSRCHQYYLCEKVWFGRTKMTPIRYTVGVNEQHELVDMYEIPTGFFARLFSRLTHRTYCFFRRPWFKYFNSFEDTHKYTEAGPC